MISIGTAETLHCQFGSGYTADWLEGEPKLTNDNLTKTGDPTVFYGIDLKEGQALMMGNQGTEHLSVILSEAGLTFLEKTASGGLNITTVFANQRPGTERFAAVHSRHTFIAGHPLPSQYHGTCVVP